MELNNELTFEKIKEYFEEGGYYPTDDLVYFAFNGFLKFKRSEKGLGQDIYAVCLEGPPGAGKTKYSEVYSEMISKVFNEKVEMISYQCDPTTGKSELFEEINITAVVSGDLEKINIPGKIIQAIKEVNSGKKVVLFIDEYDKSREETDAFLLQFLQSGKINSVQHGDLEIKDEYKNNLQVIICQNDKRVLSRPLTRRLNINRLDYMKPEIFYKVAQNIFYNADGTCKVDEGILNLVVLIYNDIYSNRKLYNSLPACSELLTAIEDADNLSKYANAPKDIIYKTIINSIFKDLDNLATFEAKLAENNNLKNLIGMIKKIDNKDENNNILDLIKSTVFKQTTLELFNRYKELELIEEKIKGNNSSKSDLDITISSKVNSSSNNSQEQQNGEPEVIDNNLDDHSKYELVCKCINEILNDKEALEDDDIISAYDLKKRMMEALTELRDLDKCKERLIEKINIDNTVIKKIGNFFRHREEKETSLKCERIYYETKDGISKITFYFSNNHYLHLAKQFSNNGNTDCNIYFDDNFPKHDSEQEQKDNLFVQKYYTEINYILDTLEKWSNILKLPIDNKEKKMSFGFKFFQLLFSYNTYGNVRMSVSSDKESEKLFYKTWVGEQSINSIIENNNNDILRKIPIRKEDLDDVSIGLIGAKQKEKVLQK